LDEGLRIERDEIGLVAVDALVVSGVERAGFFWFEREIAEALAGAHFSRAQDQVIGFYGADRVDDDKIPVSGNGNEDSFVGHGREAVKSVDKSQIKWRYLATPISVLSLPSTQPSHLLSEKRREGYHRGGGHAMCASQMLRLSARERSR
jgi:hypothetical protein